MLVIFHFTILRRQYIYRVHQPLWCFENFPWRCIYTSSKRTKQETKLIAKKKNDFRLRGFVRIITKSFSRSLQFLFPRPIFLRYHCVTLHYTILDIYRLTFLDYSQENNSPQDSILRVEKKNKVNPREFSILYDVDARINKPI